MLVLVLVQLAEIQEVLQVISCSASHSMKASVRQARNLQAEVKGAACVEASGKKPECHRVLVIVQEDSLDSNQEDLEPTRRSAEDQV